MRKQLIFTFLILQATLATNLHAAFELLGLFSWAAFNTTATCLLCCMRCNDKTQWDDRLNAVETASKQNTKNILELTVDLHKVRDQSYATANQLHLISSIATGALIGSSSITNNPRIQRPRSFLKELNEPISLTTSTELNITPSSPRTMRRQPASRLSIQMSPTECQ